MSVQEVREQHLRGKAVVGQPAEGTNPISTVYRVSPPSLGESRTARVTRAILLGLFVVLMALFIMGPLVWLGIRAFSGAWRYPDLLPSTWTMSWWKQVFDDPTLFDAIKLSLTLTPVVTAVSMVVCLPAAYAFARFDFPGRRFFLIAMFATNAFPRTGLFIAMASLFYSLNIMSTFTGLVVIQLIGTLVFMTWIPAAACGLLPTTSARSCTPPTVSSGCATACRRCRPSWMRNASFGSTAARSFGSMPSSVTSRARTATAS